MSESQPQTSRNDLIRKLKCTCNSGVECDLRTSGSKAFIVNHKTTNIYQILTLDSQVIQATVGHY